MAPAVSLYETTEGREASIRVSNRAMDTTLKLGVYRRLDNRLEGLPDDSPRALELHNRRRAALHAVLDTSDVTVQDWGLTDDTQSHEYVELAIAVGYAILKYAITPGLKLLGEKLAEKAVDEVSSSVVRWLVSKLRPAQERKEVLDFDIALGGGTHIRVDPPERGEAEIHVSFADGTVSSISYHQGLIREPPTGPSLGEIAT
jgi:hypothetical protein